ncbi:MAG: histidine kinase dimerization/phospho-acceptor domain-containing protein [Candidatus Krumholzibacteriales bacterium]
MIKSNGFEPFLDMLKELSETLDQGLVLFGGRNSFANERAVLLLDAGTPDQAVEIVRDKFPGLNGSGRLEKGVRTAFVESGNPGVGGSRLLGLELHNVETGGSECLNYVLLRDFSYWSNQDEMRKEFISSISHRLRTPITSIHHALEVINDRKTSATEEEWSRFLNIGLRNIHKLISLVDELQKLYMVQSEEKKGCRGLFRIGDEVYSCFYRLDREGTIEGFELESCDCAVFTQISRVETFVATAADLFRKWLGVPPCLHVKITGPDYQTDRGGIEISIRCESKREDSETLRDYLYYSESHRSLIMERLAISLEGKMGVGPGPRITLSIPECPVFDREKDLIYPLNSIIEEARAGCSCFCLIDLGLGRPCSVRGEVLRKLLGESLGRAGHPYISMGERDQSYLLFFKTGSVNEAEDWMEELNERFIEQLGSEGIPYRGGLKWDIKLKKVTDQESAVLSLADIC